MFGCEADNRVAYGKERIILRRRGKDVVAMVPLEDLARLEELEDRLDARNHYRYRVGDHRIIHQIDDEALLVTVARVRHRRDVYRGQP